MNELKCIHLKKTYGKDHALVHAVNDISYTFKENTFYSIIGKSGSGKSTLLQMLSGFMQPTSGQVLFNGKDIHRFSEKEISNFRAKKIGFIYQDFRLVPELTVSENIQLPLVLKKKEVNREDLLDLCNTLDITKQLNKYPFELSGGEMQRTAIARAVFSHPSFLFADEPTGNLDKNTAAMVLDCLVQIQMKYRTALILVTHDLDMARCADEILHLEDGKLV